METTPWFGHRDAFGVWAGLRLPEAAGEPWPPPELYPAEVAAARDFGPLRRAEWLAGRRALRQALAGLGVVFDGPLPLGPRGAPRLPTGVSGSLSHKRVGGVVWAVALVAPTADGWVGVDVEVLDGSERLAFSLAEAAGKALDPLLGRFPGTEELDVRPAPDGTASLAWRVVPSGPLPDVDARWQIRDGFVLASARATESSSDPRGS